MLGFRRKSGDRARPSFTGQAWTTDLKRAGEVGAFYLLSRPTWLHRHVETVAMVDERLVRRQVTVDLTLPLSEEAWVGSTADRVRYFVPVLPFGKSQQVGHIDLRDESGTALPLLTRGENGILSASALVAASRAMAGSQHSAVDDRLRLIAQAEPEDAKRAFERAIPRDTASRRLLRRIREHHSYPRFRDVMKLCVANSLLWTPLEGVPGERRVVKFTYDEPVLGTQSIMGWIGAALGWLGIIVRLDTPHIRDAPSYHFQLSAPEGLELRDISVRGILTDSEWTRAPATA